MIPIDTNERVCVFNAKWGILCRQIADEIATKNLFNAKINPLNPFEPFIVWWSWCLIWPLEFTFMEIYCSQLKSG